MSAYELANTRNRFSLLQVVSLPDTICLSSRSNTKSVTNTLLIVIRRLLERLSSYRDAGLSEPYTLDQLVCVKYLPPNKCKCLNSQPGLISALSSLSIAFPPSLYHNPWSSVSVHSHGLISLLVDIADASAHSPAFLAKILRLQAAIMGGEKHQDHSCSGVVYRSLHLIQKKVDLSLSFYFVEV